MTSLPTPPLRFERFHDIVIDAPAANILDYVSNPNSWPKWIAATHAIDSPDRPLQAGETFHERWATRTGEASLGWRVTAREQPWLWEAQTHTSFIGTIIVRYEIEPTTGGQRFRRRLINPDRPKMPTEEMIRRTDEEAVICLRNIKQQVERSLIHQQCLLTLDHFMAALNAHDSAAMDKQMHFPHVRLAKGTVVVYEQPGSNPMDLFDRLKADDDWLYSEWVERTLVQCNALKAHYALSYNRFRSKGSLIGQYESLYVLAKADGRWGILARSSLGP